MTLAVELTPLVEQETRTASLLQCQNGKSCRGDRDRSTTSMFWAYNPNPASADGTHSRQTLSTSPALDVCC
eukprot:1150109-Pelagomonas_calceolata.AAC.1